ncbi:MAG: SDR family NAD(P)-dependent oxidoreductase, partial [Bacteroidota bacterium]
VHPIFQILDQFQKLIDLLVNNAGAFFDQGAEPLSADMEFVKNAFETNLIGAWRMIKAFHPLLEKSTHPRIVNVSSGAGSFGDPIFGLAHHFSKVPVYGITKLALNGLTVKLAKQFEESKIKINSVDPGFTATYPGTEKWGARPVSEGAKSVVWAALLPDDGPSGGFFRDGERMNW